MGQPTGPALPAASDPTPTGADDNTPTTTGNTPHDVELARLASEAKSWRTKLRATEADLEKLRTATQSDTENAIAKAKAEGEQAYKTRWREAVITSAAVARLAEKGVTATELAAKALDLSDIEVDENGRLDTAAIDSRIEALLKRYPLLAPEAKPEVGRVNGEEQRRVTSEGLIKADEKKMEELLRFGLGR